MKTKRIWDSILLEKKSQAEVEKSILVKSIFHHELKTKIEENLIS